MKSLHRLVPILVVFASAAWMPSSSFAELAPWDQERVTTLAAELAKASNALYDTFLKEPQKTIGSGQAKDYYRLRQLVRLIKVEARQLSDALAKGEGYEPTLPIYNDLMTMVRDAREVSKRTFTSSFVLDKATAAGDILRQIAPYYDPNALKGS